jgi:hypothetical protein
MRYAAALIFTFLTTQIFAQPERWQQRIKYNIDIKVDDVANKFNGTEKLEYTNNSPDTLTKIFLHLYWNAFQPNSSMDVRSRELGKLSTRNDKAGNPLPDWDTRVKDRISKLKPDEIGYNKVSSIKILGVSQKLIEHETILEVQLGKPILPNSKTIIDVVFEAQVPVQVRRSGRNNAEGVRFSMSQWYPKMVEYDYQGWNANPYIAREFYGVWGDYNVNININKKYMVAATGVLQNANSIGKGYADVKLPSLLQTGNNITWNFKGDNIHDFVWAADTAYKHISKKVQNGVTLHTFYKTGNATTDSAWSNVLWAAEKVLPFIEKHYGAYPYPQYSFIQGGDGGMEYAMATLIRSSNLGTVFHEWMHSWYQHILGTNESLFGWMDEGFTTFAENEVTDYYNKNWAMQSPFSNVASKSALAKQLEKDKDALPARQADDYGGYFNLAKSGFEEPLTTHADHFNTNFGYAAAAYSKGATFLSQLGYIVGDSVRNNILLAYYRIWKFKHPNANDFIRVAEKTSGISLQWYKEYWMNSTKTIDYKIGNISNDSITGKPQILLERIGKMPMPIDVLITYKDGSKEWHYIPLNLMFANKLAEDNIPRIIHEEWLWTHPSYSFNIDKKIADIKSIEIDPSFKMADVNRVNNKIVIPE